MINRREFLQGLIGALATALLGGEPKRLDQAAEKTDRGPGPSAATRETDPDLLWWRVELSRPVGKPFSDEALGYSVVHRRHAGHPDWISNMEFKGERKICPGDEVTLMFPCGDRLYVGTGTVSAVTVSADERGIATSVEVRGEGNLMRREA